MKLPGSPGGWIAALVVTTVAVALIFRVPQIEKMVIGSNTARNG
jgi:hypothetical protein